jgi:hypothetical protein
MMFRESFNNSKKVDERLMKTNGGWVRRQREKRVSKQKQKDTPNDDVKGRGW